MGIATKISDTAIEIDKVTPAIPEKITRQRYERKFIEEQIIAITAQRDEMIALKEAELAECQAILSEMDKLGVVATKVAEPMEVVE